MGARSRKRNAQDKRDDRFERLAALAGSHQRPEELPSDQENDYYDLIEPPDDNKEPVFGLAKAFPQHARRAVKQWAENKLETSPHRVGQLKAEERAAEEDRAREEQERKRRRLLKKVSIVKRSDRNSWFRVRGRHRAEMAEFLGTFVYLFVGLCVSAQVHLAGEEYGNATTKAWGWGFGLMSGIYVAGGYSGAHLNPTVSLNLWIFRGFPSERLYKYWFAQFCGAMWATIWSILLYYPLLRRQAPDAWSLEVGHVFFTHPVAGMPVASAWFNEVSSSAVLQIAVLAVGDSGNVGPVSGMNALILGLILTMEAYGFGYLSPFLINPFRDLCPRIFCSILGFPNELWTESKWWWLVGGFTGPILGSLIGSLSYDLFVFSGSESPLNFPSGATLRFLESALLGRRVGRMFPRKAQKIQNIKESNDEESGSMQLREGQPAG